MVIVETPVFTRQVQELLPDDEYRQLQLELAQDPTIGDVIRGSGGLRKVRWAAKVHGKRGGVRVIYYWAVAPSHLLMLLDLSQESTGQPISRTTDGIKKDC